MKHLVLILLTLVGTVAILSVYPFEQRTYFENGQLSAKSSYKLAGKGSRYEMYYPDGALFLSANYSNRKLNGIRLMYSPNGKIIRTESWINGRLDSTSKSKKKNIKRVVKTDIADHWRLDNLYISEPVDCILKLGSEVKPISKL
jgi:hypothetical protein